MAACQVPLPQQRVADALRAYHMWEKASTKVHDGTPGEGNTPVEREVP